MATSAAIPISISHTTIPGLNKDVVEKHKDEKHKDAKLIFLPLCSSTTCQSIVRKLSNPQKVEKSLSLQLIIFFVSDTSWVGFWPFWLRFPGLGPNCKREVFHSSFYWKLG